MSDTEEVLIETPDCIDMDRSDVRPLNLNKPIDDSLQSKLLNHYKKGMKKPNIKIFSTPIAPETVNRLAVPLYLFTILAAFEIGLFHVMPLMYQGQDNVILFQQAVVLFLFVEIMMNWLGIRYVDSSYKRFIQRNGDPHISTFSGDDSCTQQPHHSNGHSSAVLMNLITEKTGTMTQGDSSHISAFSAGADRADPKMEAEKANAKMNRINDQVNSRSIDDLIGRSDRENRFTSSELSNESVSSWPDSNRYKGDNFNSPRPTITTDGRTVVKSYPYWSWVPCYDCGRARPPRCHHCPLCRTCVLKRDHHCFFAGRCVGYRNHRFFCVFLVYAFVGCMYATLHGFPYIALYLWQDMSYMDLCFPVSVIRYACGYVSFHTTLSVTTLTLLLYFDALTLVFMFSHAYLIWQGTTSFEKAFLNSSLEITDTRSLRQKIRAVLGPYWVLGFIFPTNFCFEPEEDPITWPDIRVLKH
ncbi:hypothetical protein Btru_025774 [Bulinus truncatus]|nr:hypothetical protein Btru_025774 [Bulinus truncatus]